MFCRTPTPSPHSSPSPQASPSPHTSPSPTPAGELSASASAAPGALDAPASVSFTGAPAGGTPPYTFNWSFGDGASSTGQNPKHTYSSAGTYTATLKLSDSKGLSSHSNTKVTVYPALNVTPTVTLASDHAPMPVAFTASVQGGLAPYKLTWAYGDGSSETAPSATHSYGVGTFKPTLSVSDAAGGTWTGQAATVTSPQAGSAVTIQAAPRKPAISTHAGSAARTLDLRPPAKGLSAAVQVLLATAGIALFGSALWVGLAISAVIGIRRLG